MCAEQLAQPRCSQYWEGTHGGNGGTGAASSPWISPWLTLSPGVNTLPRAGIPNLIKIQGLREYELRGKATSLLSLTPKFSTAFNYELTEPCYCYKPQQSCCFPVTVIKRNGDFVYVVVSQNVSYHGFKTTAVTALATRSCYLHIHKAAQFLAYILIFW